MLALSTYFAVRAGRVLTIDHGDASLSLFVLRAFTFEFCVYSCLSSSYPGEEPRGAAVFEKLTPIVRRLQPHELTAVGALS